MRFWCTIQHADGSFDEAYPFERSLAATAFTTFYVGEALEFAGDEAVGREMEDAVAAQRTSLAVEGAQAGLGRRIGEKDMVAGHAEVAGDGADFGGGVGQWRQRAQAGDVGHAATEEAVGALHDRGDDL